jgi:hypothetical protein
MKNLTRLVLALWFAGGLAPLAASGAPFLVCDPYPAQTITTLNVTQFVITGLGASPITTSAQVNSNGTQQLHYDLSALNLGVTYTVTATAINGLGNMSSASPNFTFSLGSPATPTGLSISPT